MSDYLLSLKKNLDAEGKSALMVKSISQ